MRDATRFIQACPNYVRAIYTVAVLYQLVFLPRARPDRHGNCWPESALRAAPDLRSAEWTVLPDSFVYALRAAGLYSRRPEL